MSQHTWISMLLCKNKVNYFLTNMKSGIMCCTFKINKLKREKWLQNFGSTLPPPRFLCHSLIWTQTLPLLSLIFQSDSSALPAQKTATVCCIALLLWRMFGLSCLKKTENWNSINWRKINSDESLSHETTQIKEQRWP